MPDERFADHLLHPVRQGHVPADAHAGVAGGAVCGDLVTLHLAVDRGVVVDAGFEHHGCGAALAAASAAVELALGADVLDVARLGSPQVAAALGGLSVGKLHAADLAADALHQALGAAVRDAPRGADADPDRVLVAMSGGVDSAVAALLAGPPERVAAVTVELWRDPENDAERSCCSASAVRHARALAHRMGLPHFTLDLRAEFRAGVVEPWMADHARGLTPNPCTRCNGHVRLDAMLAFADRLGAGALATGHYARTAPGGLIRTAVDEAKDQSYVLARLAPATAARLRFPLGEHTKPQVRARAEEAGLAVARTPDSQDLCFLAGTGAARFLERHGGAHGLAAERPGDLVDAAGRRVGAHAGAHRFTVGQRRGLGVGGAGSPQYVLRTDVTANTVTIGPRAALDVGSVGLGELVLHRPAAEVDRVQLRAHGRRLGGRLDGARFVLDAPATAAAPGQLACLLAGDVVAGCATITA